VVVGAGGGGLTAASEAKKRGVSVALVEKDRPGGDCNYHGCVPTKTLIHTAKVLHYMRRATDYGLPEVDVRPDFARIMAHKDCGVDEITAGGSFAPFEERGYTVFRGEGSFISSHEVRVNGSVVRGEKFVVAVGTEPAVPPIEGLRETGYITNVEALDLKSLPRRLTVLGGGPIGMEFAQLFARFGSQVTVLEMLEQILPREDREVAGRLQGYLEEEGIKIHTGARGERVERVGDAKVVTAALAEGEMRIEADEILVAAGRKPATDGLGLDSAGVETERGWVAVDETLRTSAPNIWAVGDCTGKFLFTHAADYQARVVAHNLFAEGNGAKRVSYRVMPWVTFTDPELARVGLTEDEARSLGMTVKVGRLDFSDIERAHMMLKQKGMIKVVADEDNHILGATVLGTHADDLIHEFALAIKAGLKTGDLLSMIHAYPTLSEGARWSMWAFEEPASMGV
jgi:pyruvate/2-oxoglutarate dehydrogenase complex dihydrolipoamide dehydrogenase (E3) component